MADVVTKTDGKDGAAEAWPSYVAGDINTLTDRAAMGLPESYVAPLVGVNPTTLASFLREPVEALCEEAGNVHRSLETRLNCGVALSILGDPRLSALSPLMVTVPAGIATIGTERTSINAIHARYSQFGVKRNWIEKEAPRFQVQVESYRLAKYPVTNSEYLQFLAEVDYPELPTSWINGFPDITHLNRPVYTVSPMAAASYVRWLSASTGRRFRLPTEYEWEYAAAGPDGTQFPWGDEATAAQCNTMETGLLSTSPVGIFPAANSQFGLCDMAGNVEEFVDTTYHVYPGGDLVEDDLFKELGYYQIARGGAFNRFVDLARCQRRHGAYPKSLYAIGFRIAEDIAE